MRTPEEIVNDPHTLSELIGVAISDFKKIIEEGDGYFPSFGDWHNNVDSTCYVCLAGAVMAKTMDEPFEETLTPSDFRGKAALSMSALNHVRNGYYSHAYNTLFPEREEAPIHEKLLDIAAPNYRFFEGFGAASLFLESLEEAHEIIREIEEADKSLAT